MRRALIQETLDLGTDAPAISITRKQRHRMVQASETQIESQKSIFLTRSVGLAKVLLYSPIVAGRKLRLD